MSETSEAAAMRLMNSDGISAADIAEAIDAAVATKTEEAREIIREFTAWAIRIGTPPLNGMSPHMIEAVVCHGFPWPENIPCPVLVRAGLDFLYPKKDG